VRRVIGAIGQTFIAAGVLILLFVVYQLWGTNIAEARTQDRLTDDFARQLADAPDTGTTDPTIPPPPPEGEAVAIIKIPKIHIEKAVVEGVGVPDLKKGPGHYPESPMPGQPGNAAIAGHRTTYGAPFFRLDELAPGDEIRVTTRQGDFLYRVSGTQIVRPDQNEVLTNTEDNRLTLTTCHPRFSARQRMIVTATLETEPAPAPPPETGAPAEVSPEAPALDSEESLSGDRSAAGPALAWGGLAALVWLVTWLLSKRWGKVPAYAMGAPVFLVVLFVFYENFARLLPANV
jgi:sortase A